MSGVSVALMVMLVLCGKTPVNLRLMSSSVMIVHSIGPTDSSLVVDQSSVKPPVETVCSVVYAMIVSISDLL